MIHRTSVVKKVHFSSTSMAPMALVYYLSLTRLSLTQDSQSETGVNLIERTDHNGVRRCNENQNFEYHPLALEAIHLKLNHHRYP